MILVRKSKGSSDESIKPPTTTVNSLIPRLDDFNNAKFWVKIYGCCLNPDRVTFAPKKKKSYYVVYKTKSWPFNPIIKMKKK